MAGPDYANKASLLPLPPGRILDQSSPGDRKLVEKDFNVGISKASNRVMNAHKVNFVGYSNGGVKFKHEVVESSQLAKLCWRRLRSKTSGCDVPQGAKRRRTGGIIARIEATIPMIFCDVAGLQSCLHASVGVDNCAWSNMSLLPPPKYYDDCMVDNDLVDVMGGLQNEGDKHGDSEASGSDRSLSSSTDSPLSPEAKENSRKKEKNKKKKRNSAKDAKMKKTAAKLKKKEARAKAMAMKKEKQLANKRLAQLKSIKGQDEREDQFVNRFGPRGVAHHMGGIVGAKADDNNNNGDQSRLVIAPKNLPKFKLNHLNN